MKIFPAIDIKDKKQKKIMMDVNTKPKIKN